MENTVTKFGKEMIGYSDNRNDFIGKDEITVTITINEYRDLVSYKASHDGELSKLKSECSKYEDRIRSLQSEIQALRMNMDSMNNKGV